MSTQIVELERQKQEMHDEWMAARARMGAEIDRLKAELDEYKEAASQAGSKLWWFAIELNAALHPPKPMADTPPISVGKLEEIVRALLDQKEIKR